MFDRPIFIIAAPRSGSSFLFETISQSPSIYTIGGESHGIFEGIDSLNPANRHWESNCLTAEDATPDIANLIKERFAKQLRDRDGNSAADNANIRFLEKTPKNALRIPFLKAIFPDARFIYLAREPKENLSSIIEAWKSSRFITYPSLPGWAPMKWSLLLTPGWRSLIAKPIENIAAHQWQTTHQAIIRALADIPESDWCIISYADLLENIENQVQKICEFAEIEWDKSLDEPLPLSSHTLTPPKPDKWKKNETEILSVLPSIEDTASQVEQLLSDPSLISKFATENQKAEEERVKQAEEEKKQLQKERQARKELQEKIKMGVEVSEEEQNSLEKPKPLEKGAFKSSHTSNFSDILKQLNCSLLVSTYQAGKLIVVREDQGKLNTHFKLFNKPMGMCADQKQFTLGTQNEIIHYRNIPAVAPKLEPKNKHDACYVMRDIHNTADIDIHEMARDKDGKLWFINTKFSCLCTIDTEYSFVPEWRPPFVTHYSPTDRCHLNGLAMRNGEPRYVTSLGVSNEDNGWRPNKARGGMIMDITNNRMITDGLSMPHSPRWYNNQLWVCESGDGSIARVDEDTGKVETLCVLPGFTRGIDFVGEIAFVGLSQVRESAVFSGIPITTRFKEEERCCGVWCVNMRTGETLAFLKFEGVVEEIFSVEVLHNTRFPEILDPGHPLINSSYVLPDEALKEVAQPQTSTNKNIKTTKNKDNKTVGQYSN